MSDDDHDASSRCVSRDVRRRFDGREVLQGLDLDISPGQFVALLGRSGTGKTTFLRVLGGLDPDYDGEVLVPEHRAVVFQEPRLIPWLRVLPNVTLGLPGRPQGPGGQRRPAPASRRRADRGRPGRPRPGLAGHPVRRRGPARRPGPRPGQGAAADAAGRAVRRPGRPDPHPHARAPAGPVRPAPPGRPAGHPRRRRGRSCSPTAPWCWSTGPSPWTPRSTCPVPGTGATPTSWPCGRGCCANSA